MSYDDELARTKRAAYVLNGVVGTGWEVRPRYGVGKEHEKGPAIVKGYCAVMPNGRGWRARFDNGHTIVTVTAATPPEAVRGILESVERGLDRTRRHLAELRA